MTAPPSPAAFDLPRQWADPYDLGFSVFPIPLRTKRPTLPWKAYQTARAPLDTVRQWASAPSNVGIVTGAISGLIVLDLDTEQAVQEAQRRGIPDTLTVRTAKGLHVYFKHPGGTIGNRAGLLPGWDIRGDGGYVVAPGSVHETRFTYQWENPPGLFDLAPLPDWLAAMLAKPEPAPVQAISIAPSSNAYGDRAIDNELGGLRRAGEGERNHALNRAAFNLAQLAAGGIIAEQSTQAHLRATAAAIGLEPGEIETTLASGWAAGFAQPRAPQLRDAAFARGAEAAARYDPATGEIPGEAQEVGLLPVINFDDWQGDPPPRRSAWGSLLPLLTTTMLTGPGGVGKSLFEQMMLTCIALGLPFLGQLTMQMNTLYVTCEDDASELWRRQAAICSMLGITLDDLKGRLHLVSLTGEPKTAIATFNDAGQLRPTKRWHELEATCDTLDIRLFAFDNATDAMAGDLNDLHQVAEFVGLLTGLAIKRDGVAMILHHPNKQGDDWLGSVAWHNKVRSRLIIEHTDDNDPDVRTIKNPKANYGPTGGAITFRWHEGAFVRDEDLSDDQARHMREISIANGQNTAFLACLRAREKQGVERMVGPSTGPNYAPSQFEGMPEAKGYKRAAMKAAMDRLFAIGMIESAQIARPGKGKGETKTVIVEVAPNGSQDFPNASPNASRTRFPNGPEHPPERSRSYPVYTTYNKGAAHVPPAPVEEEAGA